MAGTIAPFPKHVFLDNNGNPAASHKLFTYLAGTTTKQTTYSDSALGSANANPIVLDSSGRATIFLPPNTSWKFVLAPSTDTDPPSSPLWTVDNVQNVPAGAINVDVPGTAGETLSALHIVFCSTGTGGLTAGRWYKTDADTDYMSLLPPQLGVVVDGGAAAANITVRTAGRSTGFAGFPPGTLMYLSTVAGTLDSSVAVAPAFTVPFATADSSSSIIFPPTLSVPRSLLFRDVTSKANSGTGETDFWSWKVPTLALDGEGVDIDIAFNLANNANTKTVRLDMAGTKRQLFTHAAGVAGNVAVVRISVNRFSATTVVTRGFVTFGAASGAAPTLNHLAVSDTVATTAQTTWKITGQSGTASDDITGTDITVRMRFGGSLGT